MTSHNVCQSVCDGTHCNQAAGHDGDHTGRGTFRGSFVGPVTDMFWNWAADDLADTECDGCGQPVNRCQCEEEDDLVPSFDCRCDESDPFPCEGCREREAWEEEA
jgi:hypothetical protein